MSVIFLATGALPVCAQSSSADTPKDVTFCELSRDPAAFNHEFVRLTGFVTHAFEDFQISDPECPTQHFSIWLMYGGKAESNTMYCCPGERARASRERPLTVEDVDIPLVEDTVFHDFTTLLKQEVDTTVRVAFVGRFFSGKKERYGEEGLWRGYGHMGCCSLFAIQQIESFEPHNMKDVDYTAEAGFYENEGCKWKSERDLLQVSVAYGKENAQQAIHLQEAADQGQAWTFSDPERVAIESLKPLYPGQSPALKVAKKGTARVVFRWRNGKNSVVVVVTRPYWLSFYAASKSVAWTTAMVKEAECR